MESKAEKVVLTVEKEIAIRFSEVDSMAVVWHGHYVKFLEDGREAFGVEHGLTYMDAYKNGYMIPVVKLEVNYKSPVSYEDGALIRTTFVNSESAKILFDYEIINKRTGLISATARSVQAFIDAGNRNLLLYAPEYFINWKKRVGLIGVP